MIVTLQEAVSNGLDRYYTGKPCKRGHVSSRRTSTRACIDCSKMETAKRQELYPDRNKIYREQNRERLKPLRASAEAKRRASKNSATVAWINKDKVEGIYMDAKIKKSKQELSIMLII